MIGTNIIVDGLQSKILEKYKLSFVQGRFSQIGSYFQYFPIDNWENELKVANKIGLKNIEWIISDLSNPLFNKTFFKIIKESLFIKVKYFLN